MQVVAVIYGSNPDHYKSCSISHSLPILSFTYLEIRNTMNFQYVYQIQIPKLVVQKLNHILEYIQILAEHHATQWLYCFQYLSYIRYLFTEHCSVQHRHYLRETSTYMEKEG